MSKEISAAEKSFEEILIDLMAEKLMSAGIQASLMRGVQASSLTSCGSGASRAVTKKKTKHSDELVNAKLIPSILPDYIPPLASVISHDCVPRDFDYTVITMYLSKGIRVVRLQLERIPMLNISDYNLGDHKSYGMLTPHKYLTKTKGKKSKIIPQPCTMDIVRSTILNVMKIPHFERHQEVNTCVKRLLSCFYVSYLCLEMHITINPTLIHRITRLSMQGSDPQEFYLGKATDHAQAQNIKETYGDVEKGKRGYKVASIQNGVVCLAYHLIVSKLVKKKKPMQVTGFVVDLAGKCVEGLQMNWVSYLMN
jgi:hypothetical protein